MKRNSESGNALLMVTLVSMVLASALLVLSNKVKMRSKSLRDLQVKEAREQVFKNLRRLITTPSALKASTSQSSTLTVLAQGNQELARCLDLSGTPDCSATGSRTFVGFDLYDEFQVKHASGWPAALRVVAPNAEGRWPETLVRFSGLSLPTPQFDKKAGHCKNRNDCPLAPFTAFRAWCAQPVNPIGFTRKQFDSGGRRDYMLARPSRCDQAEFIQFFIAVGGRNLASQTGSLSQLLPIKSRHNFFISSPSALGSRTREPDEIVMTVNEINSNGSRLCPTGMSSIGLDSNGLPRCEYSINPCVVSGDAALGKIIAGFENGQLVCRKPFQGESCAPLEAFYGVKTDGTLDCRKPKFSQGCAQDQVAIAFDNTGTPICERAQAGQVCPAPSDLVGFDTDGIAVCKNAEVLFAGIPIVPTWQ